jgi:2-keto-4-pentenoate hydratase/2-oxohepta-3-ene-1,7-dioic acid hydratase in catechol pathway
MVHNTTRISFYVSFELWRSISLAHWIRFEHKSNTGFGTLDNDTITVFSGDMFNDPKATGDTVALDSVKVLTPTEPTKMICLWNNFRALAERLKVQDPDEPLYFFKSPSSFLAHDEVIKRPPTYSGNIVYEGELGIVIGKRCSNISEEEAGDYIFGYTCINDVTAADLLNKNPSFAQWHVPKVSTHSVFSAQQLHPMLILPDYPSRQQLMARKSRTIPSQICSSNLMI